MLFSVWVFGCFASCGGFFILFITSVDDISSKVHTFQQGGSSGIFVKKKNYSSAYSAYLEMVYQKGSLQPTHSLGKVENSNSRIQHKQIDFCIYTLDCCSSNLFSLMFTIYMNKYSKTQIICSFEFYKKVLLIVLTGHSDFSTLSNQKSKREC